MTKSQIYKPDFPIPIFKIHLGKYHGMKEYILSKVLTAPTDIPDNVVGDRLCTTSYFSEYKKELFSEFIEMVQPELDRISNAFTVGEIQQVWYQKYVKGESHSAHNHVDSRWSGVFYANYDPVVHKPTLFHIKEHIDYTSIVEGDVIIFPALLYHEVLPCETDVERIIFYFNTK